MANIRKVIGKEAADKLKNIATKGIKEAVESGSDDVARSGSKFIRDNLHPDWEEMTKPTLKRAKRIVNDNNLEDIVLKQGERFERNSKLANEVNKIQYKGNHADTANSIRERRESISKVKAEKMMLKPNSEHAKEGARIRRQREDLTLANNYADTVGEGSKKEIRSAFSRKQYDEYAKRNKVDESYILEKERQSTLKEQLKKKHESNTQRARQEKTNINKEEARKLLTKSNIQKGVGLGVGGYLVLNMFDQGGKMSNAELYGQQQQYGGY